MKHRYPINPLHQSPPSSFRPSALPPPATLNLAPSPLVRVRTRQHNRLKDLRRGEDISHDRLGSNIGTEVGIARPNANAMASAAPTTPASHKTMHDEELCLECAK
jgi:hypothetical protein